ncbi:MAG: AMP-binding protein, partial [Acidimicrobiia bacterium]|nr:AMP-binding protein [Acidimicrobiia bacterium]
DSVFDILAAAFGGGAIVGPVTGDSGGAALVLATSGTTGSPKGVRLTISNLEAAVTASASHLGHGSEDRWLLDLPLHHVAGLSILFRQAWTGGSVLLRPGFDPIGTWEAVAGGVTMVSVVPTMLHRLLEVGGEAPDVRTVLVGGGPVPLELLERAEARGLSVRPTYGMTETFGQVATLRPEAPLANRVHPLPGVDFKIGEEGRIAIRSPQVSPGYVGCPDREGDWLNTNDLGLLDDDGALVVLGRADTIINTGGEKVAPEMVEGELRAHPSVGDVVVVGIPDPEWGERVCCAYSGEVGGAALAEWLAGRLPRFMIPKRWTRMEEIPRTSIGKPDRAAVSASFGGEVA